MSTGGGPMAGQMQASPTLQPAAPTLAIRLAEAENRLESAHQRISTLERQVNGLISTLVDIRDQVGLPPLPPDYFA